MRVIGALLCVAGFATAAFLGFIGFVAFSDARNLCDPPGAAQCSEARSMAATFGTFAVLLLVASFLALRRLTLGSPDNRS